MPGAELIQTGAPGVDLPVARIKHGEKISAPGVYDIPMGWYHSDCCVGPSVSSTGLRKIYQYSPKHYWDTSYLNPNREEEDHTKEESMALRVGRAAHTLMLEPHLFQALYKTRPGAFADWRTKAAKDWRADQQMAGVTVLEPKEMQQVHGVAKALRDHELFKLGILEGDIERAIIWQDEKTGIWIKVRPDVIPRGSNILADLKCTNDCRAHKVDRKIYEMGYDMQLALAGVGMEKVLRRVVEEYVLVMAEYDRPFGIRIAVIPHTEIERALSLLRFSLNRMAECLASGDWPSFDLDDNSHSYRNNFQSKLIDAEISGGRLPREF